MENVVHYARLQRARAPRKKGRNMNNKTTRLSQLKELHQRIVNHPGHGPSTRWELWGRIHNAEQLLAGASARSPRTTHRTLAEDKRSLFGRLSLTAAVIACGLALMAQLTTLGKNEQHSSMWAPLVGTAIVSGVSAAGFAMRAEEYHRVVHLFETAHELEPIATKPSADAEEIAEMDVDSDWVWVYECDEPATVPIFSAAYAVPLLSTV